MSYWFHPDAENEFNQAIDYYEKIETGLGYDFAIERKKNAIFANDRNLSSLIFCFFGGLTCDSPWSRHGVIYFQDFVLFDFTIR